MICTEDRNRQGKPPDLAPECLKLWEIFPLISGGLGAKAPAVRIRFVCIIASSSAMQNPGGCWWHSLISPLSPFPNCLYIATPGLGFCGFQHCWLLLHFFWTNPSRIFLTGMRGTFKCWWAHNIISCIAFLGIWRLNGGQEGAELRVCWLLCLDIASYSSHVFCIQI